MCCFVISDEKEKKNCLNVTVRSEFWMKVNNDQVNHSNFFITLKYTQFSLSNREALRHQKPSKTNENGLKKHLHQDFHLHETNLNGLLQLNSLK